MPKQHRAKRSKYVPFSKKQRKVFSWWHPLSPVKDFNGIITDGAIRSGKTFSKVLSFIEWAFFYFEDEAFAICGKTVGSVKRNILFWLKQNLLDRGYQVHERRTENLMTITKNGIENTFYIFGGRDESSQDLIQGVTLAGVLFDEVALMPESFVNQAAGRCSVEGAKLWFNCNPDGPSHWFKLNWLDKIEPKKLLHLHFTMQDNPSLSEETKQRYISTWQGSGVFYQRFILGLWVAAEGAIYPMLDEDNFYTERLSPLHYQAYDNYIAIDYGTQNPTHILHIIDDGEIVWVDREYRHSGREASKEGGTVKTDSMYADDLIKFMDGYRYIAAVIDPSAASFKAELATRGIMTIDADNEVLDGIRMLASAFQQKVVKINKNNCPVLIRELQGYAWNPKASSKGLDEPLKVDDHGPDGLRYFEKTIISPYRLNMDFR